MLAFAGLLVAAVVSAGCGDDGSSGSSESASSAGSATSSEAVTTSTASTTTSPVAGLGMLAVEDEPYREPIDADGARSTVDIYVGDGNEGGPVVVLLHGWGPTGPGRPADDLGPLGEEIADLGATVFYFGWQTGGGYSSSSVADLSCVGPFVAARAADFGADPDRIVIVGHSMGAATGSMLAFSRFDLAPSPECTQTGSASSPIALVGIAGAYGSSGGPLDDDHSRFRVRSSPAGTFRDLDADEEIRPGLTAAQIYQLDGYSALPPDGDLDIVLVVGSEDQHVVTDGPVTVAFADALEAGGVDVETIVIDGADHDNIVDPTTDHGRATLEVIAEVLANTG